MADRYWVGGSGTWNASSTTNWAATSGGASGATAPTSADNVFFDANSNVGTGAFTVTVTGNSGVCADFTVSSLDGAMSLAGSGTWSIYGSFSIPASNFTMTGSMVITFAATTTGKTITTNGTSLGGSYINFTGVGGGWTLQDNITFTGTGSYFAVDSGTVNLNDKTVSCAILYFANGFDLTRSITTSTAATFNVYGNNTTIVGTNSQSVSNLTITGTLNVYATYTGSVGSRSCIVSIGNFSATQAQKINIFVNGGTDTFSVTFSHNNLDFTGFSGTYGNNSKTIYGNLTLSSGMTVTGGAQTTTFGATSGTKTITTNNKILDFPITFDGVGGTWQLIGNLTMSTVTRTLTLTNGTFNANGYNVTIGLFSSSNSNTRALQMGGGIWTVLGSGASTWLLTTSTNMTLTNSNSMIDLTSTTAKTFAGGGLSYGTLRNTGSGALTMTGTNTFVNLRALANLTLTSSTTTTISNTFSMDGRYGSLVYLTSSAAANATISKASGKVYTTFCNISKITATGGATFRAPATPLTSYGNVDGGTNSGWTFTAMGATDNPNPGGFSSFFS